MATSVNDLSNLNFSSKSHLLQLGIVAMGRPLPLSIFSSESTTEPTTRLLIEQVQWLTYCDKRKQFFCWPCLLFMPQFQFSIVETNTGADFKDILVATNKHEITEDHLTCSLKLQMFISENLQPPVSTQDKVGHNYAVKKNHEMLKCIIDAVCCVVAQKQLDTDGKYSSNLISIKDCKTFLQLLKDCHPRKVDVVEGAVLLLSSNPGIINHLVDAMTRSVKISIKNETKKSTYVSILLSQHGSSRVKSQMSTILRYINRGKVYERFIGFTNYVGIKTRTQLMQCIIDSIEEYDIAKRFLALSLDGEISYGQSLINFTNSLFTNYSFSYYVPWYAHGFGYVLLQTLAVHTECGLFLKMISGMQDFFRIEKHFNSLEVLLLKKTPYYCESPGVKWNLHLNFVVYVAKYRCYLIEFFENVISNSRYQKNRILAQAMAFRSFLQEFSNVFLLKLFYEIFSTDFFDETFNFRLERNAFNCKRIILYKKKINQINLARIWRALEIEAKGEKAETLNPALRSELEKQNCNVLFKTLITHLCYEIDARCHHLSTRLIFCDLFDAMRDCPSDEWFTFSVKFNDLLREIMVDAFELRLEMNGIKSIPNLWAKRVHELLEHFAQYNSRGLFPHSHKLVEFILTLPYLPASRLRRGASKLEDIRKFSYFPEGNGIPSGEVSVLSIECELLRSLRQSPPFYDEVLARFYEVNKTIPLVQI